MSSPHLAATARRSSSRIQKLLFLASFILILTLYHSTNAPHDHAEIHLYRRQDSSNSSVSASPSTTPHRDTQPLDTQSSSVVSQTSSSSTSTTSSQPTSTSTSTTSQSSSTHTTSTVVETSTSTLPPSTSTQSVLPKPTNTVTSTPQVPPSPTSPVATDPTPATTLVLDGNPLSPDSPATSLSSPNQPSSSPTGSLATSGSSSFWKNKGGVAATFLVVSLLILGVVAIAFLTWWKRRKARRHSRLEDDYLNRYSDPSMYQTSSPSLVSPGGDPFRSIHEIPSPPGSSDGHASRYNISPPIQLPEYYNNNKPRQYLPPSQIIPTIQVSVPNPARKNSNFRRSDDSFYGGAARPTAQY